ncbi:hypothetical protein C8A05DRAFT_12105 [Staphylotrichum tortipilum]|uniref:Centrosomin N-terminal motif 1 domain-containing protein n=1 Tax=Staphylotrichum tortipilum TaxID=2831512 RepID=A0AAN6RX25_9PEZI|nr:hypothetical protein C8A05DRAFT_12105 [Staphylotrichum longicolle]
MDSYGAPSHGAGSSSLVRPPLHVQPAAVVDHVQSSPVYPISPLLQERLQRSRRVENDRMSSRPSTDMLSSSTSSRLVRSPSPTSSQRTGSSSGGFDPAKTKKGLGVKEMEQTLSTLHKQNFDLKLELYHRRERQTGLEDRLEALEREAKERDDLNDSLVRELEKRDKAVEEAIGMILTLEKRVEQLLLERNMVHQVEADGAAYPRISSPVSTPAPPRKTPKFEPSPFGEAKTPIRMPSFVSDRSENTENLRSVYLGALAGESALTLPRFGEDTPDTTRMDPRFASPALSELSQSSFISVYGRGTTAELSSPPGNSPWPWDRSSPMTPQPAVESPTRLPTATPSRQHRPGSSRTASGQYHNIGDVLDMSSSPLQRIEKLDPTRASRPLTANRDKDRMPVPRPPALQPQIRSKQEKREALERVLTQGHFSTPQTLPPTPDTLSTATLPHNETPTKEHGSETERGCHRATETAASRAPSHDENKLLPPSRGAQPASTTAFDSRKHLQPTDDMSDTRAPRSATETRARDGSSWGGDAPRYKPGHRRDSTTSSVDTWLRESLKPDSVDALDPLSSVSQTNVSIRDGRISPDLFSFPSSTAGWSANAMFGALTGSRYAGAGGKNGLTIPVADMLGAIGAAVPSPPPILRAGHITPILSGGPSAPPPPNRRSSLAAKTGSTPDATPGAESNPPRPSPHGKSPARAGRARSNSTDVRPPIRPPTDFGLKQDRAMTRHYPPTTSRPRSRGLNNFFRRSTGSADVPPPPASAPPTESAFKPPPPAQQQQATTGMGMPSWVRRGSVGDEDRTGATPPPILRNKAGSSRGMGGDDEDGDGGVVLGQMSGMIVGGGAPLGVVPQPQKMSSRKSWGAASGGSGEGGEGGGVLIGNAGGGGAGKRKWLGLGRVSSLRSRGGV